MKDELVFGAETGSVLLSETSSEYRNNREELKARVVKSSVPFGWDLRMPGSMDLIPGASDIFRDRIHFAANQQGEGGASEARSLFVEALSKSEIARDPFILELTRDEPGSPQAPAKLLAACEERVFPNELVDMILMVHWAKLKEYQRSFEKELPVMRSELTRGLERIIDDSSHPLTSDILPAELIERRLSEVGVAAADPLQIAGNRSAHFVLGEYDADANSALMQYDRASLNKSKIVHRWTYAHEMMHVLSGRTIRTVNGSVVHVRSGVGDDRGHKRRWLNEAITETLAGEIALKGKSLPAESYVPERAIYQKLIQRVPEELFLKAYFENVDPQHPEQVEWGVLNAAVDAAHYKGFFENLNFNMGQANEEEKERIRDQFDGGGGWK